jgi:sigma-B regulation protein RsbU (phosphoserine phosphatase)
MEPLYSMAESKTIVGEYLALFAATEIFIFVFIEIVVKIKTLQRVLFQQARRIDYIIFILVFGGFSIFGTYIGIPLSDGVISNIRDLAPMVAGLVAGPYVGLAAGLIGGIHRFFMGGFTALSCGLSTVLAGVIGGLIFLWNKKKLVNMFQGIGIAIGVELIHGLMVLLISRPFDAALDIALTAIPEMMIANAIGVVLCIIIIHNTMEIKELRELKDREDQFNK